MPHPPKTSEVVVVADTATEVIDDLYSTETSPVASHSPNYKKLIPYEDKVEEGRDLSLDKGLVGV